MTVTVVIIILWNHVHDHHHSLSFLLVRKILDVRCCSTISRSLGVVGVLAVRVIIISRIIDAAGVLMLTVE